MMSPLVNRFKARLEAHGADCQCGNVSLDTVVAVLAELEREMLAAGRGRAAVPVSRRRADAD